MENGMEIWFIIGFCINCLIGALIGKSKGRADSGFVWALFLGPIGWLLVALMEDIRPKCTACKGVIESEAIKCKNCGAVIGEMNLNNNNSTKKCPFCAEEIKYEAIFCRFCHKDLPHIEEEDKNKYQPEDNPSKIKDEESTSENPGFTWFAKDNPSKCNDEKTASSDDSYVWFVAIAILVVVVLFTVISELLK